MSTFDDIKIKWTGKDGETKDYTIPSSRVMMAIGAIEEHVTLPELGGALRSGKIKMHGIACAYAAVLRIAGCDVTDEEVYASLFRKNSAGIDASMIRASVNGLLVLMVPPVALQDKIDKDDAPGKSAAATPQSRQPSK